MKKNGIKAKVLFFVIGDPWKCETVNVLREYGVECEVYSGRKYTEDRMHWILQQVELFKPDVFVPNLDIPAYHVSKWIRRMGVHTVGVLHSDDPFYHAVMEEFVAVREPHLSAVVSVSQYLEDQYKSVCEKFGTDLRRIPYGVPLPERKATYNGQAFHIAYVGRFVDLQKRITDVTRAFCKAAKQVPGIKATFYGSGPAENKMKKIISEHGCDDHVYIAGVVSNHELQQRLSNHQVITLLSDFEGLPIALMEAMATGLVPVCTKMKSGIPELVQHNETGWVVTNRDEGFVDAIRTLKEDKKVWERLSGNVKKVIEEHYSVEVSTEKWLNLFESLESKKGNKSTVTVPKSWDLPPRNEGIRTYQDPRWPGFLKHTNNKVKVYYHSGYSKFSERIQGTLFKNKDSR